MNERLFARLHARLASETVVLASVLKTRGATPRKGGSRMLIGDAECDGSVGGGMAEALVIAAARSLLTSTERVSTVEIDLTGRTGAAGVCGGGMLIGLRRWGGDADRTRAEDIANELACGRSVTLRADDFGGSEPEIVDANVRLIVIGAGHCGLALHDLAQHLDFDQWVYDERDEWVEKFSAATHLSGEVSELARALDTSRTVFSVCLNRDFHTDVAALRVLCTKPPHFLGMMGSGKRIQQVRAALPEHATALEHLTAPVGIEIDAQTPHEIAVCILAQLIHVRRALGR